MNSTGRDGVVGLIYPDVDAVLADMRIVLEALYAECQLVREADGEAVGLGLYVEAAASG